MKHYQFIYLSLIRKNFFIDKEKEKTRSSRREQGIPSKQSPKQQQENPLWANNKIPITLFKFLAKKPFPSDSQTFTINGPKSYQVSQPLIDSKEGSAWSSKTQLLCSIQVDQHVAAGTNLQIKLPLAEKKKRSLIFNYLED